jgi:hypothetical protein
MFQVTISVSGADTGFQVRGVHLKTLRRAKGGTKIFGVFRVKNHDFMPKKIIFFPILGGGGGGRAGCAPEYEMGKNSNSLPYKPFWVFTH